LTKTRVLTLMFHRINDPSQGYCPKQFAKYLDYLVQNFPIVVPGETLPDTPIAICLTFDDAYYDFYHDVYPLLRKHQIKAILAVPVQFIIENTNITAENRLSVPYPYGMNDSYQKRVPFCTWDELKEMSQDQVVIASHGYSHANLADPKTDLHQEIVFSQQVLQQKLQIPIKNFIYPYGRMSKIAHAKVCRTYEFGIRIGGALNLGWDRKRQFVYRINADPLWTNLQPINQRLIKKLTLKFWMNRLRLK